MARKTDNLLNKLDTILLILFPALSIFLSLSLHTNFSTSALLFFGIPSLWFSFRTPTQIKRAFLFSVLFVIPLGTFIDYVLTTNGAWFVPASILPFRLFGIVPIDDLIWTSLLAYYVVIFYEHFFDKGSLRLNLIDQRMKYFIWPVVFLLTAFFIVILAKPQILIIKYAYFLFGLVFVFLPAVTFLSFFPKMLSKYVKTASYFFLLSLIVELTALQLNHWTFPGSNFIGWVELFKYRFPFEEFFFYIVMSSVAILSYYEFFDDDRK